MKLLVAVVVLLGLLVVADRVAEQAAEGVLAGQLQDELGTRPDVEVRGFPFLTQVLRGRYADLAVAAGPVRRDGAAVTELDARLRGVDLPLSAALSGRVDVVPVDRVQGTALFDDAALTALADRPGLRVSATPQGVRVSARLTALGRDVDVSGVSEVRLEDGDLVLAPRTLEVAGPPVPQAVRDALAGRLDVRVRLPTLPYDLELTGVSATARGVVVSARVDDVVLRR